MVALEVSVHKDVCTGAFERNQLSCMLHKQDEIYYIQKLFKTKLCE
jgi:hypothetical protein